VRNKLYINDYRNYVFDCHLGWMDRKKTLPVYGQPLIEENINATKGLSLYCRMSSDSEGPILCNTE